MLQLQVKNIENKCPDCTYIKLTGMPKPACAQIVLYLTINFNEQWENLIGGRIKLGLKGGELRLKLHNGLMPYEKRELISSLPLAVQKKRTQQVESKVQAGVEVTFGDAVAIPALASEAEVKTDVRTEQKQGLTEEFQIYTCQVTTKGSEESPAWVFAVQVGEPVLKGLLKQASLGTLDVKAKPCRIEATFEVAKRDIYITDAEGLWPSDISRNKRAVLERLIVLRLIEPKFQPYLSRVELHYE